MQKDLETVHKLLGEVCGSICMALTLRRVTGGKLTIRHWLATARRAVEILEKIDGGQNSF